MSSIPLIIIITLALSVILSGLVTVQQGNIAVVTMFGKYRRMLPPGLNFKIPFVEQIFKRISIQNRSAELEFTAITIDQANVNFKAMLLYAVLDATDESIKNVAFKFIDDRNFMQALVRSIEGSIRAFVATKKQSEVLTLRKEITNEVKDHLDTTLAEWGFHLLDLQLNDITLDNASMESMSRVVASNNLKAAAENEGQALLITKTKAAEADGNAIQIQAQAEKQAAQLRGQGLALFREEVAKGMAQAAKEMKTADLDASLVMFSIWTESIKHFAEQGKGNVLFLDGSVEGFEKSLKQMQGMSLLAEKKK